MSFIEIIEESETFELKIEDSMFILRRFDSEAYRKIEKKHTKKTKHLRTGQMISETDDYAVNVDLLDYIIVDWGGIKSSITGEEVACVKENKTRLPGSIKLQIIEACDSGSISSDSEKKTSSSSLSGT